MALKITQPGGEDGADGVAAARVVLGAHVDRHHRDERAVGQGVLLGDADPGGRLPTTQPMRLEHNPSYGNFPGENGEVRYGEGADVLRIRYGGVVDAVGGVDEAVIADGRIEGKQVCGHVGLVVVLEGPV